MYMKRVRLMGKDKQAQNYNPLSVNVEKQPVEQWQQATYENEEDAKWSEFKILGSNIQFRSFASTVNYKDQYFRL